MNVMGKANLATSDDLWARYVRKGHIQTVKHWLQGASQERNIIAT